MTKAPESSVRPHPFIPDPEVPPDINGRGACLSCHLPGRPGDHRHSMPDVPEQVAARQRTDPHDE